jgi:hypothetical protein
MNSTTLPPLKPRSNKQLYGGANNQGVVANNMNSTIATTGIWTNNNNGRASTSSSGIQVQQMYDTASAQKTYYNGANNNNNTTNSNNNITNGAKSPSGDSMNSNKSLMQTLNNNTTINNTTSNKQQQSNSQSNLSMVNQNGMGSSSQQQARRIQPMSPETAMKNYMQKLTSFEHHEIFNYSDIFFIGQNAKKINGVIGGTNNNGYDDENGSYKPVQHDQIYYRFEVRPSLLLFFVKPNLQAHLTLNFFGEKRS